MQMSEPELHFLHKHHEQAKYKAIYRPSHLLFIFVERVGQYFSTKFGMKKIKKFKMY